MGSRPSSACFPSGWSLVQLASVVFQMLRWDAQLLRSRVSGDARCRRSALPSAAVGARPLLCAGRRSSFSNALVRRHACLDGSSVTFTSSCPTPARYAALTGTRSLREGARRWEGARQPAPAAEAPEARLHAEVRGGRPMSMPRHPAQSEGRHERLGAAST